MLVRHLSSYNTEFVWREDLPETFDADEDLDAVQTSESSDLSICPCGPEDMVVATACQQRLAFDKLDDLKVAGEWNSLHKMWRRHIRIQPCGSQQSSTKITLTLWEDVSMDGSDGELSLWPAGIVLSKYIESLPHIVNQRGVVELGAGSALPSLTASVLGAAWVCATEQAKGIAHLRHVIASNGHHASTVTCAELEWGPDATSAFITQGMCTADVVLVADCTYMPRLFPLLLDAMLLVCKCGGRVFVAHDMSSTPHVVNRWAKFASSPEAQAAFAFVPLAPHEIMSAVGAQWFSPSVQIWSGTRRPRDP